MTWALFWHDALTWCCASATESIRRHKQRHRHVILHVIYSISPHHGTSVKIKPHQPAITDDKISDKQGASRSLYCVCFVAFVEGFHHTAIQRANLSGRCQLNPTVQTRSAPYSSKIRTWAAPLLKLSRLEREVSDCTSIILHTHVCWGCGGGGLWSLCVCTEEQYVVIKQSWIGIINPCASLYNRPCPINSTETLEYRAHDPVDFFCLIHWNQFALSLRPTLLVLYILNKCFIRAEIKVFVDLFPNHTIITCVMHYKTKV